MSEFAEYSTAAQKNSKFFASSACIYIYGTLALKEHRSVAQRLPHVLANDQQHYNLLHSWHPCLPAEVTLHTVKAGETSCCQGQQDYTASPRCLTNNML